MDADPRRLWTQIAQIVTDVEALDTDLGIFRISPLCGSLRSLRLKILVFYRNENYCRVPTHTIRCVCNYLILNELAGKERP
jgi:hypothetical protein